MAPLSGGGLPPPIALKLLTLNTHKGFTTFNRRFVLHELREAVREVSADIVFLQEVLGNNTLGPARYAQWPTAPQYEFLADSIWTDFAYGRNAVYPEGDHGNAVLSKFPILRHQNHDISLAGPEKRGLLHCVIGLPRSCLQLHTICVHLSLRESHRRRQLRLLCDLITLGVPSEAPLIIAGDFNDWRQRAHQVLHDCGLEEVFLRQHGRAAQTFPARWPMLRLDRIYARGARVLRPSVHSAKPWSHLSDHLALSADVEIENASALQIA